MAIAVTGRGALTFSLENFPPWFIGGLESHHVVQQFPTLSHQLGACRRVQCHLTAYLVSDFPTG